MNEKTMEIKKDVAEVKRLIDVGEFTEEADGRPLYSPCDGDGRQLQPDY
jgi:hypothetical protein